MQVHVIWHPDGDGVCKPVAESIYLALNRDPHQPLLPGIGIPVFLRSAGAVPGDRTGVPRPIEVSDTKLDLRIALVTAELIDDPAWMDYLDRNRQDVADKALEGALICFDLTQGGLDGDRLTVRLDPAAHGFADRVMQHVLLACCRLLAGRPQQAGARLGAAPLKLFLSHTKRDDHGLPIAKALKGYLDNIVVERFFDEVSIPPGDDIDAKLEAEIADSALVCIRTDRYVSSPWCRRELALGKTRRRPMVVLDALSRREPRSSPLLAHLPSERVTPETLTDERFAGIVNFIALEVVRFLYANLQLTMLKEAGLVPDAAILLTRPPEARDFAAIIEGAGKPATATPILLHPDPMMSLEEAEELAPFGATFVTPTGLWQKRLDGLQLGLSLSPGDPDEQRALGISLHVEDAMRVIARQALAAGATLHYGGVLEEGSLTEALFDMIGAYRRDGLKLPPLVNHTPWPWHEEVDAAWRVKRKAMLTVERCTPPDDARTRSGTAGPGHVAHLAGSAEGRYALGRSLSSMRRQAIAATQARVVLGGKPHRFMGFLPGIVEEVLLAIRAAQPVYVLGGFGGAARLVARTLSGESPEELTRAYQETLSPDYATTLTYYDDVRTREPGLGLPTIGYEDLVAELNRYGVSGLATANRLTEEENRFLFVTASVDAAVYLIMQGLERLASPAS
ncbi:hypothetical protein [Azospirillum largimobile]